MFKDAIGKMQPRTWPYGTIKTVKIIEHGKSRMDESTVTLVIEENPSGNEGHILLGALHKIEPEPGRMAVMQFTKGCPTGGYWQLISFVDEENG